MRNLKRVLTMIMAIAMMMSLMTVGAGAVFPDQDKVKNTDAVNMNVALNIIKGRDDGKFDPTGNVTRGEMAKMICIAYNGGKEPTLGVKPTATFTDIKGHWAEAYIEYCSALGIVAGMGDGTFAPNGNVTATQAAKMLLVALGYDAVTEGFNGGSWAVKINVVASQKDLYKEISVDPNAALNRDNAAQMVWNALNAKMVKYEYSLTTQNGTISNIKVPVEYTDKRTMLSDKFNQKEANGQMTKFTYNTTKKEWTYVVDAQSFTSAVDFTKLYGQHVNVVYKEKENSTAVDKIYGIYADESEVLFTAVLNDLTIKTDTVKVDTTTYDLNATSANTDVYNFANGKVFATAGVDATTTTKLNAVTAAQMPFVVDAIDYDGDGDIDTFVAHPFTVSKVSYVGTKSVTAGASYTFEDDSIYDGIKKNDYAKITAAANSAKNTDTLQKVDAMIAGKVASKSGSSYTIDGKKYYLATGVTMNVGDKLADGAVVNGFIFAADTNGTTKLEDYAIVVSAGEATGVNADQAKLMFTDGTKKVVETDKNYSATGGANNYVGKLVTYSVNSDKEYELTQVTFVTGASTGTGFDDEAGAGEAILDKDGATTGKVQYINDWNTASDAVVFVQNTNTGSFEVITGAKLMTTKASTLTLVGAYASDETNGYSTVKLAYVTTTDTLSTADNLYGYALSDAAEVTNSDGKNAYELTLWNGKEEVKVQTKDTGVSALNTAVKAVVEGGVVAYTLNSDGKIDAATVYPMVVGTTQIVAITAWDATNIQMAGVAGRHEVNKDTVIIYVDNGDIAKVNGGEIAVADEISGGGYYKNALVVLDSSNEDVKLIVVDINNDYLNAKP